MKVVIAADSFKESLTAKEVCDAIAEGVLRFLPDTEVVRVPLADGGEGTARALVDAKNGHMEKVSVEAPLGNTVVAQYGILGKNQTAVIEMAEASGLHLVPPEQRDPKLTGSFGVGTLITHALDKGIRHFILGLGGSATNDGGLGLLMALGVRFLDSNNTLVQPNGNGLIALQTIDISPLDSRVHDSTFIIASDVNNPLCGEKGASAVFGPQKGATQNDVKVLDQALEKFARLTKEVTGIDILHAPGAGAAGGMGAALLAYTKARFQQGIEVITEEVNLAEHIKGADLIITAEGCIDGQTAHGKVPMGVAQLAQQQPVIVIAGSLGKNYQAVYEKGIRAVFCSTPRAMSLSDAFKEAFVNVSNTAENIMRLWDGAAPK